MFCLHRVFIHAMKSSLVSLQGNKYSLTKGLYLLNILLLSLHLYGRKPHNNEWWLWHTESQHKQQQYYHGIINIVLTMISCQNAIAKVNVYVNHYGRKSDIGYFLYMIIKGCVIILAYFLLRIIKIVRYSGKQSTLIRVQIIYEVILCFTFCQIVAKVVTRVDWLSETITETLLQHRLCSYCFMIANNR